MTNIRGSFDELNAHLKMIVDIIYAFLSVEKGGIVASDNAEFRKALNAKFCNDTCEHALKLFQIDL